jgi:hypothetical protein
VFVVLGMTIVAAARPKLILSVNVTGDAGNCLMPAFKGKLRMFEVLAARRIEMQRRRMALRAVLAELTLVLVFVTVNAV